LTNDAQAGKNMPVEAMSDDLTSGVVESFIVRWAGGEGGQERANYGLFLTELCDLIGVSRPEPAQATSGRNAYVFERAVTFREADGSTAHGRIDLYRRGCFVSRPSRAASGAARRSGRASRPRPARPASAVPGAAGTC